MVNNSAYNHKYLVCSFLNEKSDPGLRLVPEILVSILGEYSDNKSLCWRSPKGVRGASSSVFITCSLRWTDFSSV